MVGVSEKLWSGKVVLRMCLGICARMKWDSGSLSNLLLTVETVRLLQRLSIFVFSCKCQRM